jgi:ABC-type Fe3+ transport system substrate-binding protein
MQRIDWRKYDPDVPESDMFYDKRAVGVYTTLGAFDYNTNLVPRNKVPQSFNDLLKPEWKGKIATTPAEGNFLAFLGLPEVFGHQGMLDFVQKFSEQVGGIMPCGQIDRVTDGEFPIFGLDCGDFNVRKLQRLQRPIGAAFPKEGVPLTYIAPAIPITAAHPNSARLFIAYLLTREGQNDLWNISASDDDQLPGSHIAAEVNDLKRHGVKIINVYGLEIKHPELLNYAKEIDRIIHQGK